MRDRREGADDDVVHSVSVQNADDRSGMQLWCWSERLAAHFSIQVNGVSPILDLPISAHALRSRTPALQRGKSLIMRVLKREIHPQLEAGCAKEAHECGERRLAPTPLIGRDHRDRNTSAPRHLGLADSGLETRQLKKSGRRRGSDIVRSLHDTNVLYHAPSL